MAYQQFTPEELESEEWRILFHYPKYWVSSLGRVYGTQILKPHVDRYARVVLMINGKRKCRSVHRLVAMAFLQWQRPEEIQINHLDTDKINNRPSNLEYCTHQHNADHAEENGLIPLGENSHNAKITEADVRTIREFYASGEYFMRELADKFSISLSQTKRIIDRKTWKHVN